MLSDEEKRTGYCSRRYDHAACQQRAHRQRQAEQTRLREEQLAKAALQRAQYVARQRQRKMKTKQAEGSLQNDSWAAGIQNAGARQQRRMHKKFLKTASGAQKERASRKAGAEGPRTTRSVYAGVMGIDGGAATDLSDSLAPTASARNGNTAGWNAAESTTSQNQYESSLRGGLSELSPQAARRILHEGIRRWTTPYGAT